jgi:XTP/dITP diphosphohydrolase
MQQLLLATHNRDKAREFQSLLEGLDIEILTLDRFPDVGEIVEDGATLEDNAVKKAREVSRITGLPSLADDTGLEVFYLNKAPGVFSARYAGPGATYAENCRRLLAELRGVPPRRRNAQFRCVLALTGWSAKELLAEGTCTGTITESPRGSHGFGYDPVFLPEGFTQTYAEMDDATKNRISHRGKAAVQMRALIAASARARPSRG